MPSALVDAELVFFFKYFLQQIVEENHEGAFEKKQDGKIIKPRYYLYKYSKILVKLLCA